MTVMGHAHAEATPAPCLRCGAPMSEDAPNKLHRALMLRCGYCGSEEPMPTEGAERARVLRLRLLQLRSATAAAEAPARTVAHVRTHWATPVNVGLLFVPVALSITSSLDAARAALRATSTAASFAELAPAAASVLPFMIPLAVAVGVVIGYVVMMRVFERAARPLLLARPPIAPGGAPRCRICGGSLSAGHGASATCAYCGSSSFLGPELSARRAELLAAEASEYRRRASGWMRDDAALRAPARAFYAGLVGGALSTVTLLEGGLLLRFVLR